MNNNQIERRHTSASPATRPRITRANGGGRQLTGYAAVFYKPSDPGSQYDFFDDGSLVERIRPGAFDRALREKQDVRGLFNHDSGYILGRTASQTMTLSVDSIGLRYVINLDLASPLVLHIATAVGRGDVSGSSFSFMPRAVLWEDVGSMAVRWLEDVDLYDVGPVTFPAYESATSQLSGGGNSNSIRRRPLTVSGVDARFERLQAARVDEQFRQAQKKRIDQRVQQLRRRDGRRPVLV